MVKPLWYPTSPVFFLSSVSLAVLLSEISVAWKVCSPAVEVAHHFKGSVNTVHTFVVAAVTIVYFYFNFAEKRTSTTGKTACPQRSPKRRPRARGIPTAGGSGTIKAP